MTINIRTKTLEEDSARKSLMILKNPPAATAPELSDSHHAHRRIPFPGRKKEAEAPALEAQLGIKGDQSPRRK